MLGEEIMKENKNAMSVSSAGSVTKSLRREYLTFTLLSLEMFTRPISEAKFYLLIIINQELLNIFNTV